jgi:hypothetical protein
MTKYLWQGVSALLALVLLVGGIILGWAVVDVKGELRNCEATNAELVSENTELRVSLGVQTAQVKSWQASSEQAAAVIEKLLLASEVQDRKNTTLLESLVKQKATTCAEAMPHLRNALKELRQ